GQGAIQLGGQGRVVADRPGVGTGERLRVAVDVNEVGDRRQGSRRLDSFQLILPWDVELDGVDAGGAGGGGAAGGGARGTRAWWDWRKAASSRRCKRGR